MEDPINAAIIVLTKDIKRGDLVCPVDYLKGIGYVPMFSTAADRHITRNNSTPKIVYAKLIIHPLIKELC